MRYFHVFGTFSYHLRQNVWDMSMPIPCDIPVYNNKANETGKENRKTQHKESCTQVAGRIMRGQGWSLLTVRSVFRCVHLTGNRRTTKKARGETRQEEGRDKESKPSVGRNKVAGFRWSCVCLVFSGDPVCYRMKYRDIW